MNTVPFYREIFIYLVYISYPFYTSHNCKRSYIYIVSKEYTKKGQINMKRRFYILMLAMVFSIGLAGCGNSEDGGELT